MVAKHLRVSKSCVWSLGLWARGKGEAVAMTDKRGKFGRKRIETMMSRRSLKKKTNRIVFFSDKCNKCERQATRKGYLGEHGILTCGYTGGAM